VRRRAGARGSLALSTQGEKERRRHHDCPSSRALEMTFDDRDKAMDHAKASGFHTFAGCGSHTAVTLRCTLHVGCYNKEGAMMRI
jgi:hypothetical protein